MMPVRPKVSSSELNGVTAKRAITQCRPTPIAKNSGTISSQRQQRIDVRQRRQLVAEVGGEEGEARSARG